MDLYNLTPQQKIQILENIDWKDMISEEGGLCYGIFESIQILCPISYRWLLNQKLSNFIDLFTFENSRKFSTWERATDSFYWFSSTEQGYHERIAFKNWMVNEYKKQL